MQATLITAPILEPVTVVEAKNHLYVDGSDHDEMIAAMVATAREEVEDWTRRAIMTQTWDYFLHEFPEKDHITLPFGNLQDVSATQYVKYTDCDGTTTTMTINTDYLWETNGEGFGRVVLPYSGVWPTDVLYPSKPIVIRFVCGWTSAALVPSKIKHAIKLILGDLYESRGEAVLGQMVVENKTVERLLASERLWGNF